MKKIISVVSAILLCLGLSVIGSQPAIAASKTVSITIGDWNCRQNGQYKGSVSRVLIDAVPSNSPQPGWINGKTRSNVNVSYQSSGSAVTVGAAIFCKTSWYGAGYYRELSFGKWVTSSTGTNWQF